MNVKSEKCMVKGKDYVIKTALTGDGIEVRTYFGDKCLASYSATYENASYHGQLLGSTEEELLKIAKDDLQRGLTTA
jgi:hypothetical protein